MNKNSTDFFSAEELSLLINRLELLPILLKRQQEEEIVRLVPIEEDVIKELRDSFLGDKTLEEVLIERNWTEQDFDLHLRRPEALARFAAHQFAPGLEERFLSSKSGRDEVIYSLLRVRDPALARELWIRLEEGEVTFAEAAQNYSEGPESHRKGIVGPIRIGDLHPKELADSLRLLRPGELTPPFQLNRWHVLLRLEQLTLSRFDDSMRKTLLLEDLNNFLEQRIQRLLKGEQLEELNYDTDYE